MATIYTISETVFGYNVDDVFAYVNSLNADALVAFVRDCTEALRVVDTQADAMWLGQQKRAAEARYEAMATETVDLTPDAAEAMVAGFAKATGSHRGLAWAAGEWAKTLDAKSPNSLGITSMSLKVTRQHREVLLFAYVAGKSR
jgi:hypothetical protein